MEQLTLTEIAIDYHNKEYGAPKDWQPIELTERQHANNIHAAFKAGAEWQKDQYATRAKEIGDKIPYPNKYIFDSIIAQLFQTDKS